MTQFDALGLSPSILKSVEALGFSAPTPIQEQAIPLVLEGHDVMGLAQTGTGKTAAFGLPLVHHLQAKFEAPEAKATRALILAPTRELVNQIAVNLRSYVKHTSLRIETVIGGASIEMQKKRMHRGTDILVATPGRLIDLLNRKDITLSKATFLVLDEADQMLDLGFIHALRQIARALPRKRQTLLFSATMPKQIEDLSRTYLNDPVRIEVSPPGRAADKIEQCVHFVHARAKTELLKSCLAERPDDLSLVFSRTKHGAEKLMKNLVAAGFKAASIHGNKSQNQRERAIQGFKSGDIRVLVATDVAARGIDIPGVSHVYNFNLPEVAEAYVHRIGRTARAGAAGEAVAFCSPDEKHLFRAIEKLMKMSIRVAGGDPNAKNPDEGESADGKRPANNRPRGRNGQARPQNKQQNKSGRTDRPQQRGPLKEETSLEDALSDQSNARGKPYRKAKPGSDNPRSGGPGSKSNSSKPGGAKSRSSRGGASKPTSSKPGMSSGNRPPQRSAAKRRKTS